MDLNVGEQVFFRLSKDSERYSASVVSANEANIIIRSNVEVSRPVAKGDQLIISLPETDYYTEVLNRDNRMFSVKRLWCDRREYFRVDDVFPVACKRVSRESSVKKTKMVSGFGPEPSSFVLPDDAVHPQLWKMLVDINTKLGLVLERLNLHGEGFLHAENRQVNLSATGLRVRSNEKAEVGDSLEVKMLLPTYPPIGIVAFGKVVRIQEAEDGQYDLALHFEEMDEDVRDEIIQYALNRQRDVIRSQRQKEK